MPQTIDARPARRLSSPQVKHLRARAPSNINARFDRQLPVMRPKRLPRAGGAFLPGFAGLAEEISETEVQVGYMDPGAAAIYRGGVGPGPMGAFDLQSLLSGKNLGLLAGAAALGYFIFRRK